MQIITAILLCFCIGQSQAAGSLYKSTPFHISCGSSSIDVLIERHIIHFTDSDPSRPLQQRLDALRILLNTYFMDHPRAFRYSFTFGSYSELNNRMAATASCSQKWDFQTGRTRIKNSTNWLSKRLNKDHAYRELIPLFETIGYRIDISSMESISLCGPGEIDWKSAPRSCKTSLPPEAKLPCGALVTFTLSIK